MKYEFGFSKLILLASSIMGLVAFFLDFYQINHLYTQWSGYDLLQFWYKKGFVLPIEAYATGENWVQIGGWFLMLFPIVMGIIALELLIRSLFERFPVVHRVWFMATYCLLAFGVSWELSYMTNTSFYFFELVDSGFWWSLAMVTWSFVAVWVD